MATIQSNNQVEWYYSKLPYCSSYGNRIRYYSRLLRSSPDSRNWYYSKLPYELQDVIFQYVEPEYMLSSWFPEDSDLFEFISDIAHEYWGDAIEMMLNDFYKCFPEHTRDKELLYRFTYLVKDPDSPIAVRGYWRAEDSADFNEFTTALYNELLPMLRDPKHSHSFCRLMDIYNNRYDEAMHNYRDM